MQVRRPVAVDGRRADARDRAGPPRPRWPTREAGERVLGQVAVEREERRAVARSRGAGSRAARSPAARALFASTCTTPASGARTGAPGSTKRSMPRWTVRRSSVGAPARREERRDVDPARLVVAADADGRRPPRAIAPKMRVGERPVSACARVGAQEGAARRSGRGRGTARGAGRRPAPAPRPPGSSHGRRARAVRRAAAGRRPRADA